MPHDYRCFERWAGTFGVRSVSSVSRPPKKHFGITLEELDRLTEAVAGALRGQVLTREELVNELRAAGVTAFGSALAQSWGTIFKPAAFGGRLCFAPSVGQRVRLTRLDT